MTYPYEKEFFQLMSAMTRTDALYGRWARQQGVSPNLLTLHYGLATRAEPYTPTEVSDAWCLPKQTLNSLLRTAEKEGHLRLEPIPGQSKQKYIRLTPAGEEHAEKLLQPLWLAETAALHAMGPELVQQMIHTEEQFHKHFAAALQLDTGKSLRS